MPNPFLKLILPLPIAAPLNIDSEALLKLEALAVMHNLFPLLYVQLQRYHARYLEEACVKGYLQEKRTLFLKIAARSMQQETAENEVVSLLESEDIPAIVIKGNQIAKDVYNDPSCRNSADIDILIKQKDVYSADQILSNKGFERTDKSPIGFWLSRLHHAQYRHPNGKDFIEVHWNFSIPGFFNLSSKDIWHSIRRDSTGRLTLSPEMTLVMLLMHHHMHWFRDLKILLDVVWAAYRYEQEIDWQRFSKRLRKAGLIRTTKIALGQGRRLWGKIFYRCNGLKKLDQHISGLNPAVPALLNNHFKMDIAVRKGQIKIKDDIFFRLALDSPKAVFLSFLKTVIPMPDAIKHLYDDQHNWRLPKNYLRFIKWRLAG